LNCEKGNRRNVNGNRLQDLYSSYELNAYEVVEKLNCEKGNRRNVNGNRLQDLYSSYELIALL